MALFSLSQVSVVPVDTHVMQIGQRDYCNNSNNNNNSNADSNITGGSSTLTAATYAAIAQVFRSRFGVFAGWAHSVLFAAELPLFTAMLPQEEQESMKVFAKERKNQTKDSKSRKVVINKNAS